MLFLVLVAASYLGGTIMFAKFVGDIHHVDLRAVGSGNLGFANAARHIGIAPALPILFGDVAKGFLPTAVAASALPSWQAMIVGFAAVCGHLFPFWLRFRGGKGVATGLGVTLALVPILGALALAIYLIGIATYRKSAPGSLLAAWGAPVMSVGLSTPYTWGFVILAMLITWSHRSNITQMMLARRVA